MQRSTSVPLLDTIDEETEYDIRKSNSSPEFNQNDNNIHKFSGRGNLGLQFLNIEDNAVLTNILHNSVFQKTIN